MLHFAVWLQTLTESIMQTPTINSFGLAVFNSSVMQSSTSANSRYLKNFPGETFISPSAGAISPAIISDIRRRKYNCTEINFL